MVSKNILKKIQTIKIVLTDVDGVLTDGGMYYSKEGDVMKRFFVRDGMGVTLLRKKGIPTIIVTKEKNIVTKMWATKMKIEKLYQGIVTKEEILDLIFQKNKFDYNTNLIEKIKNNEFNDNEFIQMGQQNIKTAQLNSIRDNKKFDINAVKILYSLPINSFTLINDEKENIYLAKVKDYQVELIDNNNEIIDYTNKQNSNLKNNMLKSYDLYLNSRYNVTLNQKTIERVKNFFQ